MSWLAYPILAAAMLAQPSSTNPAHEGVWYVSDNTDNNTGRREVYAFQMRVEPNDPDFVTLTMRCSNGKPTFFVEWENIDFPDQAVLTIGAIADPDAEPVEHRYLFEKSEDAIERGLRATPETSSALISALGSSEQAAITAHLTSRSRSVIMNVSGTQQAWNRISRHCPVRLLPRPQP